MRHTTWLVACFGACVTLAVGGCGKGEDSGAAKPAGSTAPAKPAAGSAARQSVSSKDDKIDSGPRPTILLAQAQFVESVDEKTGKTVTLPSSRMVILRQTGSEWQREEFEDPESNVLHKAVLYENRTDEGTQPGILTIGATAAALKFWQRSDDGTWTAQTWWNPTFGSKFDRLRDFEIGDVTGDGEPDLAIVTHPKGIVAVLSRSGDGWQATEIEREKGTWIHECELGDLDGDGLLEIYTTPSNPNKFDGKEQPGKIMRYWHTAAGFERQVVEEFPLRHVKEILVANLGADGKPALLAAVEAELATRADAPPDAAKTLIKRYRYEDGKFIGEVVCALPDGMCRFLNAGDVDGDGKPELIASTHKQGIWLARPGAGDWALDLIDADSGGFEHATALADLDGDGVQEIYVSEDTQRQVRRYRWIGGSWSHEVLETMDDDRITFGISAGLW